MNFKVSSIVASLLLFCTFIGCQQGDTRRIKPGDTPPTPCTKPPDNVFKAAEVDSELDIPQFLDTLKGKVKVNINPKFLNTASKASVDSEIRSYLRCLAIHEQGYTREQAAWLEASLSFTAQQEGRTQKERVAAYLEFLKAWPFPDSDPRSDAEKSVTNIFQKIVEVRGVYESIPSYKENAKRKVRATANKLGDQILNISDSNLGPSFEIAKYEYAAYAKMMAAAVENSDNDRIRISAEAVNSAEKTKSLILEAKKFAATGDENSTKLWNWISDGYDFERTLYILAVAQAINAKAGGTSTVYDVKETIKEIPSFYLEEYSPESHADLKWAIEKANTEVAND